MNLRKWFGPRGAAYVSERARFLLDRYGLSPRKAYARIERMQAALAPFGRMLSLATPGGIVRRYPQLIARLQAAGAEIAVHSYDHIDLRACGPARAVEQLERARRAFAAAGIEAHGFRCPYLSCSEELIAALPAGLFEYSSNCAVWWDAALPENRQERGPVFDVLSGFYRPLMADAALCVPRTRGTLVEIPVCAPDDLQMHDGLHLAAEGILAGWLRVLEATHRRGEMFNLIFHPELATLLKQPFVSLLHHARSLAPAVWLARLCDLSSWWREQAAFGVAESASSGGVRLTFMCTPRATILARGLDLIGRGQPWHGPYQRIEERTLDLPAGTRPFVGLAGDVPSRVGVLLREQGYLVRWGQDAAHCTLRLDAASVSHLSDWDIVNLIEDSPAPLVRYGRWPHSARSALCLSGDLDALSLVDYAQRLTVR